MPQAAARGNRAGAARAAPQTGAGDERAAPTMAPLIAVRDLIKTYDLGEMTATATSSEMQVRALRGVTLDVAPASSSR